MLRDDNETAVINEQAAKFYDMYEDSKGEDALFWLEYEAHMSTPIDERETYVSIINNLL